MAEVQRGIQELKTDMSALKNQMKAVAGDVQNLRYFNSWVWWITKFVLYMFFIIAMLLFVSDSNKRLAPNYR